MDNLALVRVVYRRDGRPVPPSHRFQGVCEHALVRFEASASARLGRAYQLIHGRPAPISIAIASAQITEVPSAAGRSSLMRYLGLPEHYGQGFEAMRHELAHSLAAFDAERGVKATVYPGPLGLGGALLAHTRPTQLMLIGTSSLRLDWIAATLAGVGEDSGDRWVLDAVVDEVLGGFVPLADAPLALEGAQARTYIDDLLALAPNRARADAIFLKHADTVGTLWGTLVGLRSYSNGESFVGRNVGLRSVWRDDAWQVELVFMDHDGLHLNRPYQHDIDPKYALHGIWHDHLFVFSYSESSTLALLERIYAVSPEQETLEANQDARTDGL